MVITALYITALLTALLFSVTNNRIDKSIPFNNAVTVTATIIEAVFFIRPTRSLSRGASFTVLPWCWGKIGPKPKTARTLFGPDQKLK